jgi:DNA-directed RNA polymerase subunit RPC12/RpoP
LCGAPAHVQWYDDIYCYPCGKRVVEKARESAPPCRNAVGAVDRAEKEAANERG